MSSAEIRDLVLLVAVLVLAGMVMLSRRQAVAVVPPAVSPLSQPIEDQVRDMRHRVAGVEQQMPVLADHAIRLRTMEREAGEVRSAMQHLKEGQSRIEHQLARVTDHLMDHEGRTK